MVAFRAGNAIKVLILGMGSILVAATVPSAAMTVDFGGEAEARKDGRVVLALEIRSDVPLREVRLETGSRFPLVLHGARLDKKLRWRAVPQGPRRLRLAPRPDGPLLKALDVSVSFRGKPGVDPLKVFRTGGRDPRPSFTVIAVGEDGREERVRVSLPYMPRLGVSHE